MIEDFNIESRGTYVPFETLSWWSFEPDEFDVDYEARLEVYSGSELVAYSPAVPLKSALRRFRLRLVGFPIPLESGDLIVKIGYKDKEAEWVQSASFWSMSMGELTVTAEPVI
jgi:hypothetical protein